MISTTGEERRWFLRTMAQGLVNGTGTVEPPLPVEEMLQHPPRVYERDFGVVDMYSNLWDATFARPPSRRGSIFVRVDLPPARRRYALARETLSAVITSAHGRAMGLQDMLMDDLQESADYFAGHLLAPDTLVEAYTEAGGDRSGFAEAFGMLDEVAEARWHESVAVTL
jgi:hypothetical protein